MPWPPMSEVNTLLSIDPQTAGNAGNGRAQNMLGIMYSRGQGVRQDFAEAVKWYRKAAEQGLADPFSAFGK